MNLKPFARAGVIGLAVAISGLVGGGFVGSSANLAYADDAKPFFSGVIKDAQGEPMEGVVVSLRNPESGVLVAVNSDSEGKYAFAQDRLAAGRYQLNVRAVGWQLADPKLAADVTVAAGGSQNLELVPVGSRDALASQLTSLEWLQSWPGTDAQKDIMLRNLVNCMFCHSLERIARTPYDGDQFMPVIQRMLTYETDHSSSTRIQRYLPPFPLEDLNWFGRDARVIADWLATVNLSGDKKDWNYELKTLPRPHGKANAAVVTVYPIPRANSVIHDLAVDRQGKVWYGNTGWDFLGKLDPKTGAFSEWAAPNFLPENTDPWLDRIEGVQDVQVDEKGNVWAAVGGTKLARFLPETEKWQVFDMPVIWRNPFLSPVRDGETALWATGITAPPDGTKRHETAFKLDINTGELSEGITLFDDKPEPDDPHHSTPLNYCYMMDQDLNGDFLCTAPEPSAIARADLKTGKSRLIYTPTKWAYPRRGYRDDQNRFWFGEFYADQLGVIDLNTDEITEYPIDMKFISPYYARPDGRGSVWISSLGSDRLLRFSIATGEITSYLMPVPYDARKVVVDTSAEKITVWLPNKNAAELIRVEVSE